MALNVIKISRISPATNSAEPLILPLTFFDLMWLKRNPTERVTFYRLTESSREFSYSEILPKLERSLALTLTHFLPLSGHLKWNPQDPKPHIVVFPQDTVSLTVAETSADFSRISSKGLRPEAELRALVPELQVSSESAPVLSHQITLFPNQGFAIGSTVHHAVMDGQTAAKFHKSWARICKYGTIPQDLHLPTLLDRSIINVPARLEPKILELMSYLDKDSARSLKLPPFKEIDDVVRITLELSQENVEKLKEKAKNESTCSDLHLSTFVVTFAYVWTCMVKTRGGEPDRPVRFRYVADFRNRLNPPVPENYFGNCVVSIVLDEYKNFKMGTQVLSVTGSNQFEIYGSDFGWGRPVNTEIMSIYGNNQISMSARRDGTGGVEIGVSLKKCEMDVFISLFTSGLNN